MLGQQSLPSPVALPPNCWVSSRFSLCNIQLVLQWYLKTEIRIGNERSTCRSWSKSWLLFLGYCGHKSLISGGASGSCFSARSAHEKVYLGGVSNPIIKALRFGTDVKMVLPLTSLFSPNLPIGHNRTPHQVLELTMTRWFSQINLVVTCFQVIIFFHPLMLGELSHFQVPIMIELWMER